MQSSTIRDLERFGATKWNNFISQDPKHTVYSSYGWLIAIQKGLGYDAQHVVVEEGGTLIGALPCFQTQIRKTMFHRLDSNRPGYGGPVLIHDRTHSLQCILNTLRRQLGGSVLSHRIISNRLDHLKLGRIFSQNGYKLTVDKITPVIVLEDNWEETLMRMSKNRRNMLRKADPEDVEIPEISNETIEMFHGLESRLHIDHRVVEYTPDFYRVLHEQLEDEINFFTVEYDGEYLGGYFTVLDRYASSLRLISGGLHETTMKTWASDSLMTRIINYAIDEGLTYVDLGAVAADINNSLYRFKESYGCTDYPIYTWEKGTPLWGLLKTASQMVTS